MGGDIDVQLDLPSYFIGDTVTGCVHVNLTKPKTVKGLVLKVWGAEKCDWKEGKKLVHAKEYIYETEVELMQPQVLEGKVYQLPFSFKLPTNAPGSFEFKEHWPKRYRCSVRYKVKAVLEVEGTFSSNVESLPLQLQVLKAATEVPSTLVYKAVEKEVKTVGMFKKGSVVVSVDVNADSFTVSDTIKVGVKVENHSSKDVEEVRCNLRQCITGEVSTFLGPKKNTTKRCVMESSQSEPVTHPGTTCHYEFTLNLGAETGLQATCCGKVVNAGYWLEVVASTGLTSSAVRVEIPVTIWDAAHTSNKVLPGRETYPMTATVAHSGAVSLCAT